MSRAQHRRKLRKRAFVLFVAASSIAGTLVSCSDAFDGSEHDAETVLKNGFIWTVDASDSVEQAIAIRDGKIIYVGDDAGADSFIGPSTEVVDLKGKMVMPGVHDAHMHPLGGGSTLAACNLNYEALTIAQFQSRIQQCLDAEGDTTAPLVVQLWFRQAMQPVDTEVDRHVLDALETNRPVFVYSTDGHSLLVNSEVIEQANITSATEVNGDGHIVYDQAGEPTGIFEDAARELPEILLPEESAKDTLVAAEKAFEALAAQGVTSFMDQFSDEKIATAATEIRERGRLTARLFLAPDVDASHAAEDPAGAVEQIVAFRERWATVNESAPGIQVNNAGELMQDGVIQAPALTASMLEPYFVNRGTLEQPDWRPGNDPAPAPYYSVSDMANLVGYMIENRISPSVHAIGDRAVRETLDAFEIARSRTDVDIPLSIAHTESVHPDDLLRFEKLDVQAVMGLQWAKPSFDSIDAAQNTLGPERFARTEPIGSLTDAGALVALGSDWPVDRLNVWLALEVAVTRENPEYPDLYPGKLGDDRPLTIAEGIRVVTLNGARAMINDSHTGSLEVDKYADLIVLDRNITEDGISIHDTRVLATMVGGRLVFGELA